MVAALYVRSTSVYSLIPGVDCWDQKRDARLWPGGAPCIAHPPCRAWGKYASWAKPAPGEKDLAFLAIDQVRLNGGILEHPVGSALWVQAGLPSPGEPPDMFGGYTVRVLQRDFGHRAEKATLLYCCGVDLPPLPPQRHGPIVPVEHMGRAERERTPLLFATWLVSAVYSARKSEALY